MKALKGVLIIALLFLISCSSDDDGDTTPKDIDVTATIDINALNALVGTDATALVTFGGVPANTFLSNVIPGDKLDYKIDNSSANTEVRIIKFRFNLQGSTASTIDWEQNFFPVTDTISVPAKAYIEVNPEASSSDDEYKFDIDFKVYVNGVSNNVVYSTDPKLKVRSRR